MSRRAPLIQAYALRAESLINYFEGDYENGLFLAKQARDLHQSPRFFPGVISGRSQFDANVEIGEVLCDKFTHSTIKSLENRFRSGTTLAQLPISWGLVIVYEKMRDEVKAQELRVYLHRIAPLPTIAS